MNLAKYALVTALIGIFLLIFLAEKIEPREIKIADINDFMIDEYVKITANVTASDKKETLTLITLQDETGSIKTVVYELVNFSGEVEVTGKVVEYNGELEIQADKITNKIY